MTVCAVLYVCCACFSVGGSPLQCVLTEWSKCHCFFPGAGALAVVGVVEAGACVCGA